MKNGIFHSENERLGLDKHHAGELGQLLASKVHVVKGVWDFAVDAGAVGTLNLKDEFGVEIDIPQNSIVKQVIIDRRTAPVSAGGAGTVALGINTTTDLLAAVDADTLSAIHAGIPVGTAATAVKATASRKLQLAIGVEALTAWLLHIYCEVYLVD